MSCIRFFCLFILRPPAFTRTDTLFPYPTLSRSDGAADPETAVTLAVNAKMRRTGVCGATESILIDRGYPAPLAIIDALVASGCEVRGDKDVVALSPHVEPAAAGDWDCEYLDAIVSIAMVDEIGRASCRERVCQNV